MDNDPADSDGQLAAFAADAVSLAVERREVALGHLSRLGMLADTDFDALDDVSRVDGLIELQKAQAWLDSLQVELLAAIASHDQTPEQWCQLEVAAAQVLWRLLTGPQGATVRQIGLADSRLAHLSRAISWIRGHDDETLRMEELAAPSSVASTAGCTARRRAATRSRYEPLSCLDS